MPMRFTFWTRSREKAALRPGAGSPREASVTPLSWKSNIAALFIAQACAMIAFSFVFPFIPLYVLDLGVNDYVLAARWAGAIGSAAAITMALFQPLWGTLADRYGRRIMVLRSIGAASITLVLMGMVQHPWQLLILRLLQGAFTGTVAASNALVATTVPKERLGSALGLMQVALFGGMSVGPLLGGYIADMMGYRASCFAAGALMVISLIMVFFLVHESFTPPAVNEQRPSLFANSHMLLTIPGMFLILSISFLIQYGGSVVAPVLTLYIRDLSDGVNAATLSGIIMAATGLASALAAIAAGRIGDHWGHRRMLPICLVGGALACVPQAFVHSPEELCFWRVISGIFIGGLMPSANALLAGLVPVEHRGSAFGLAGTAVACAHAAGPMSGAFLCGFFGMGSVFYGTTILYLIGFVFVLLNYRHLPGRVHAARKRFSHIGQED